jgi:hypothetical protein
MYLFLDDNQRRIDQFLDDHKDATRYGELHTTKFAEEAIELIRKNRYDYVSLDHDLEPSHYTPNWDRDDHLHDPCFGSHAGCDVAKFIASLPPEQRPRHVNIHSWHRPAARTMGRLLLAVGMRPTLVKSQIA